LQSQGGIAGYGEGGPAPSAEIVAARAAVTDRRATESEYIRAALRGAPALEAAINNAMLDLVSRAKNVPIYRYLGGPVRFKARLLGHLEGTGPADSAPSLARAQTPGNSGFHHCRSAPGRHDSASRLRRPCKKTVCGHA